MTDDMWGTGDFHAVAEKISTAGQTLVEAARIEPGMDVLDVGCGTGNATIPAAKLAARVTGLDASPGLIEVARELGADAMVEVDWVVGDAQALPFEDDSFDRVISIFGHMFAPDHRATAAELKRVCRPGGRIAIACWTAEGKIGAMFKHMSALAPPPPEGFQPPALWGTEEHVRDAAAGGLPAGGAGGTRGAGAGAAGRRRHVLAPRRRVARRVGRGLRALHGGQLPAAGRRPQAGRRRARARDLPRLPGGGQRG